MPAPPAHGKTSLAAGALTRLVFDAPGQPGAGVARSLGGTVSRKARPDIGESARAYWFARVLRSVSRGIRPRLAECVCLLVSSPAPY